MPKKISVEGNYPHVVFDSPYLRISGKNPHITAGSTRSTGDSLSFGVVHRGKFHESVRIIFTKTGWDSLTKCAADAKKSREK